MFDMRPYRNNNDRRNNLSAYNPFREMDAFERNFFNDPFGSWFDHSALASFKTDIKDNGDSYTLEADLPGFDKKDIQIELVDGYLCVSANKTSETNEKDDKGTIIRQERCGDSCSRRFYVGEGYKQEDFKASFKNGELTITFPCMSQEQRNETKQIEIH